MEDGTGDPLMGKELLMEKLLIAILTICVLVGCTASSMASLGPAAEMSPSAEEFRYTVELEEVQRTEKNENGVELLHYQASVPTMRVFYADGTEMTDPKTDQEHTALAITETFNNEFDGWREPAELGEALADAQTDFSFYQQEKWEWMPYNITLACQVYQTDQMVSVSGLYDSYLGGAHPNSASMGWNFDLASGTFFTPQVLCSDASDFRESVAEELLIQLRSRMEEMGGTPEEMLVPDYENIIQDWMNYTVSFNEEGMTVSFAPYVLGAYALGELSFTLSYEWMKPHLGEQGCQLLDLGCGKAE